MSHAGLSAPRWARTGALVASFGAHALVAAALVLVPGAPAPPARDAAPTPPPLQIVWVDAAIPAVEAPPRQPPQVAAARRPAAPPPTPASPRPRTAAAVAALIPPALPAEIVSPSAAPTAAAAAPAPPADAPMSATAALQPATDAAAHAAGYAGNLGDVGGTARGDAAVQVAALAPPARAAAPGPEAQAAPRRHTADHAGCVQARYPALLRERGIEGVVQLRVKVGTDGRAAEVQVLRGSGWRLFDEAAVAQARGCHFRAARVGEQAVAEWVEFPVRFALGG